MAGKAAQIFETVYGALNRRRSRASGLLTRDDLKAVLEEEAIKLSDWYAALARARKQTPGTAELFYGFFGEQMPAPRGAQAEAADEEPEEEPAAEDDAPATAADVLATVLHWLDMLDAADRARVLRCAGAFFAEADAA